MVKRLEESMRAVCRNAVSRATIRSADACEWFHRQRRLRVGITERLAPVILLLFTGVAPNGQQEPDYRTRQPDDRDRQLQDQDCKLHRQITSFRKRRRCRVAGLTPLTFPYFRVKRSKIQTNVLYFTCAVEADSSCVPGASCVLADRPSCACTHSTSPTIEYRKAA